MSHERCDRAQRLASKATAADSGSLSDRNRSPKSARIVQRIPAE